MSWMRSISRSRSAMSSSFARSFSASWAWASAEPGQLGLGAGLLRLQLVARPLHFAAQIVPLALDGHLGVLGCGLGPLHRDLRFHGGLLLLDT